VAQGAGGQGGLQIGLDRPVPVGKADGSDVRQARYLDWAATTPLLPEAAAAMAEATARLQSGDWANPSSQHGPGRAARWALEAARETIAARLKVPADALIFTSGATEALAIGLEGLQAPARAVMATEHAAVREAAPGAQVLPVDRAGRLDLAALAALPEGALVAVQLANNETGVLQDWDRVAAAIHARGGLWLADAAQVAGRLPLPAAANALAVSAHKLGGPAGVGALVIRCREALLPTRRGGGQEGGFRGGTHNLVGIIGFAAAMAACPSDLFERLAPLQARLEAGARALGLGINAEDARRLSSITSLHLPGVPAATTLMALDLAGIAVSQGAACSSGTLKPSAVLAEMGLGAAASESIRVSMGWATRADDVDALLAALAPLAARARAA
jgi:cysteine desulfurase